MEDNKGSLPRRRRIIAVAAGVFSLVGFVGPVAASAAPVPVPAAVRSNGICVVPACPFHGRTVHLSFGQRFADEAPSANPRSADPSYWLAGANGAVYSFGDARFHGSMGAKRLVKPVVGIASTPDGRGYWLLGAGGGVFAFGDARFHGSLGSKGLRGATVAIALFWHREPLLKIPGRPRTAAASGSPTETPPTTIAPTTPAPPVSLGGSGGSGGSGSGTGGGGSGGGGPGGGSTQAASLTIAVQDLLTGTAASITATAPNGTVTDVTATTTIQPAEPGNWVVTAKPVTVGTETYYPLAQTTDVSLAAGAQGSVVVDYANAVNDTTMVVAGSAVTSLTQTATTGVFTLTVSDSQHLIKTGDVLAIGIGPSSPEGLLLKVATVTTSGGSDTVTATQASLTDIGPQGDLVADQAYTSSFTPVSQGAVQNSPMRRYATSESGPGSFANPFSCSAGVTASLSGGVGFAPHVHVQVRWGGIFNPGTIYAKATVSGTETAYLDAKVEGKASCTLDKSFPPAPIVLGAPIPVGPTGIYVVPKLSFDLSGKASVDGKVESSVHQSLTVTAGLGWNGKSLYPIGGVTNKFNFQPPTPSLSGSVTAEVGPHLAFDIEGVAGPFITAYADTQFTMNSAKSPWCDLSVGFEAGGGLAFDVWGLSFSVADPHILSKSWDLYKCTSPVPLTITTSSLPPAQVGTPYSQVLSAGGGTAPYTWAVSSGALPAGLSLSSGGTVSGTPTTSGTASFTVQVTDSKGQTTAQALTLAVIPAGLAITTTSLPNGVEGQAYSATLGASGGTPPYTWSANSSSLPPGLTLSSDGTISGTPTVTGTFSFTAEVKDAAGNIAVQDLSLTVSTSTASLTWSAPAQITFSGFLVSVSCPSANFCAAVDNNGDLLTFDGTTWSAPQAIDPSHDNQFSSLVSVSCPSANFCAAVDDNGNVVTFDGSTWGAPQAVDPGGSLVSVSCPSANFCAAVDDNGNVVTYDGSAWGAPQAVDPNGAGLYSVSCPSSNFCAAVDYNGNVVTYDGSAWGAPQAIAPYGDNLYSVSCSSANFCVATDNNGNVLTFDGTTWSAPQTVDPGGSLNSVSCPSSNFCAAVDYDGNVLTYNGTSWSAPQAIDTQGDTLNSVSCPSSNFCAAVDGVGDVVTYNGTSWSAPQAIAPYGDNLYSVSCPSANFCAAVGYSGQTASESYSGEYSGEVVTFDGTTWSAPQTIDANYGLDTVSCSSANFCVATDNNGNVLTFDGTTWSAPQTVDPNGNVLNSVSCPSSNFCAAVDGSGYVFTFDGTTWSAPQAIDPTHDNLASLLSVSCPSANFCAAVDQYGDVVTFDGTTWSAPQAIDPSHDNQFSSLVSVSCPSANFCAAVDDNGNVLTFDGTTWSAPQAIDPNGAGLTSVSGLGLTWGTATSVSCPSSNFCAAVGYYGYGVTGSGQQAVPPPAP